MEHESKTGGENLRNQDMMDWISELPRDLIIQILSSLSTKDVTATSVLSKSWRSVWKMVPNIKFDSGYHYKTESHSFSEIVCKSLLSCSSPVLESLYLVNIYESEASDDIELLIGVAFARPVRKLYEDDLIRFPSVFSSGNNTLEILELSTMLLDFPCRVGLKSLKKLHLINVKFRDEESVCNLLCGCPILEDLTVDRRGNYDAETFTIAVPSLQRLTIVDTFQGTANGGYVINAPSLKYLNIKGVGFEWFRGLITLGECYEFFLIENATELVEAKIIGVIMDIHVHNEDILASLASVKRLSLDFSPLKIKCPTGITFYQLVSLELNTRKSEWSNLLARMLDNSPKLQILKLINTKRPKCVPECLLFHLVTFQWTNYLWELEEELEVAKYILKNARWLKKATFYTEPEDVETLEEKREMLNELASVVRASNSCHLVFESSSN
ncbi:hypothetical protein BRARA_D02821 [Brassica rapa]|uniref:F-box domain-containing protein n=1 Tax=Brassica campestris TaxID=3711 RepID=A0A397ZQE9_BRACM|nr:hypothetical protein BRARA_D02821 [Brassica rapa]